MRRWRDRSEDEENPLLQSSHVYGFSPLWMRRWRDRSEDVENPLLHTSHVNEFSPVWVVICPSAAIVAEAQENSCPHTSHRTFSPMVENVESSIFEFYEGILMQMLHNRKCF